MKWDKDDKDDEIDTDNDQYDFCYFIRKSGDICENMHKPSAGSLESSKGRLKSNRHGKGMENVKLFSKLELKWLI